MAPGITVLVTVLPHGEGLELPAYATPGASGCDLRAAVSEPLTLAPGERVLVPTGIAIAVPEGYEGQVRMRSGLALQKGLILPNAPGTIDSDYRGEIRVIVANISAEPASIERGERIAQLVIAPVERATLTKVATLPDSGRGSGGFGSTGNQ
jgi:dUTP pyrophosphatase